MPGSPHRLFSWRTATWTSSSPSGTVIGEVGSCVAPERFMPSHVIARSLRNLCENVALARRAYSGDVSLAEDLTCFRP